MKRCAVDAQLDENVLRRPRERLVPVRCRKRNAPAQRLVLDSRQRQRRKKNSSRNRYPTPLSPSIGVPLAWRSAISR